MGDRPAVPAPSDEPVYGGQLALAAIGGIVAVVLIAPTAGAILALALTAWTRATWKPAAEDAGKPHKEAGPSVFSP
jgi:hypothetical protein